jgi:hypothetical protein
MTHVSDEQILRLLRSELAAPAGAAGAGAEAPADLWVRVQHRVDEGTRTERSPFDWILLATVLALCILRPEGVAILLLHF